MREGSSDKVYILVMSKNPKGRYEVTAYYGRRGKNMRVDKKGVYVDKWHGLGTLNRFLSEKVQKGYIKINENK
jgi:hypothetical protein